LAILIRRGKGASSFSLILLHRSSNKSPRGSTAAQVRPANQMMRQMNDPPIVADVGLNCRSAMVIPDHSAV
jgi:hypothetical protein